MSSNVTYNGIVYPCNYEIDCPGNSACYYIDKTNPTKGYCGCNVEQGNQGLLCDQINLLGYGRIVILSLDVAFSFLVFLVVIYQLFLLMKAKKISVFDVRTTSLLMCGISLVLICIYAAILLYWMLFPNLPFVKDEITKYKRRPFTEIISISLSVGLFFYATASLNISILWLEVAIVSKRFQRINRPQLSKNYRYAVFALDCLFALVAGFVIWFALPLSPMAAIVIFTIILIL